jgi:16S rRNA (guanine527-N7)-methyltransferase
VDPLHAELAAVIEALVARGDLPVPSADDTLADALLRYLDILQRWNAIYNLTAVRAPADMMRLHLADCLSVIGPMLRRMDDLRSANTVSALGPGGMTPAGNAAAPASPPLRVLDVGSGGGLPGVVLAVALPGCQTTCVDTVGKKAAFVQQVAAELRLSNLTAAHSRVERLRLGPFDVVTSRAFASLADFVRLTRSQLAPAGVWMAMKARYAPDEIALLPPDIEVFHVERIDVPGLDAERCLVWMRPRPALNP